MSVWDNFEGSSVVAGLARQVSADSAAHAWLLLGPRGSGKLAVATAMAAALNCRVEPRVGCSECSSCRRVLRHRHPDVHFVAPEGPLIPVDVIREIVIPEAARSPFEGVTKVFIILEADRMNPAAQNALLKTLEEPQPDTVFVLVSDNEEEVLETLRSRCRIVRLAALEHDRIRQVLEREGADERVAEFAARVSSGDLEAARALCFDPAAAKRRSLWASLPARLLTPTDALEAAAEIVSEARETVKERDRAQRTEIVELAEALGEGRGTATARNALATRHRRELKRLEEETLGEALVFLASFYRDVVALRSGGEGAVLNLDLLEPLAEWAGSPTPARALLAAAERCLAGKSSFVNNANPTLCVEAALVETTQLARPPERVSA